jgi:ferric-dicitrate binding protein FerR (iron transport regulator)
MVYRVRARDVTGDARLHFIEWLRRSPEHIQAYLEAFGVWAELPTSDPSGKINIAALIARARSEVDVIELCSQVHGHRIHKAQAIRELLDSRFALER